MEHGRRLIAALAVAVLAVCATTATAAPTEVDVRIEGRSQTLFEGPVVTEGHAVRARSESESHPCDGINPNDPQNTGPGPTPTASGVDATTFSGGSFDGRWDTSYDDFLVTEWDGEREAEGNSWSVLVNGALLSVGGCQYELGEGAQVLWTFGPDKPLLALYPLGAAEGAAPLTAVADVGVPFEVEVLSHKPASGSPPARPGRAGYTADGNAQIVPVQTAADGAETTLAEQPLASADEAGDATITFTSPGWHRIKAIAAGALRSNRIDVCVCAPGQASCGQVPGEDIPRESGVAAGEPPSVSCSFQASGPGSVVGPGQSAGGGVAGTQTGNQPAGAGRTLRFEGQVLHAHGALWNGLRLHGRWHRLGDVLALEGVVMAGSHGSSATAHLPSGRPVFALFAGTRSTRIELRDHGAHRVAVIPRGKAGAGPTLVALPASHNAGNVTLRVLEGQAELDAVATAPR